MKGFGLFFKEGKESGYVGLGAFVICIIFAAVSVRWVLLYRTGGALDIDEAGYIAYSIALERALIGGGISGWLHAFFTPIGQAPLSMVVASWFLAISGTQSEWVAILTMSGGLFSLLLIVYLLGKKEYGTTVAFYSVIIVGTTPYLIDYARSFNFSTFTSLFFIATIFCFRQTEGMSRFPWVAAVGACAALMILSRTMALAFLPAFAVVFLVESFFWRTPWKRLLLSILLGCVVFLLVCGPWFAVNFRIVFGYLFSFGYGKNAAEYGGGSNVFSYDDVMLRLRLLAGYTKAVHAFFLLVGIFAITLNAILSKNRQGVRFPFAAHVSLLTLFCVLVLMSSQNMGSAFDLPLLPPLIIAMVGSLFKIISSTIVRRVVMGLGLLCMLPVYILHADQKLCEVSETELSAKGYDLSSFAYCGGIIKRYVESRYGEGLVGEDVRELGKASRRVSSELSLKLAELPGSDFGVAFASRHILINVNTVNLDRIQKSGSFLPVHQIDTAAVGSGSDDYISWLSSSPVSSACYIVALNKTQGEFPFAANPDNLRTALSQLQYRLTDTIKTPAEDQWFDIFRRPAPECERI